MTFDRQFGVIKIFVKLLYTSSENQFGQYIHRFNSFRRSFTEVRVGRDQYTIKQPPSSNPRPTPLYDQSTMNKRSFENLKSH